MKDGAPHKLWWSADEIAAARLPDLPTSKRGVAKLAQRQNWRRRDGCVRRRRGQAGGGVEFHFSLFPIRAREFLSTQAALSQPSDEARAEAEDWAAFEALPQSAKAKAAERAEIVRAALELERAGVTRSLAVARVAALRGVGQRSVWNWIGRVEFARSDNWLPLLAGRHRQAARKVAAAPCSDRAWEAFKADYLRLEAPPLTDAWRRTRRIADAEGWDFPSEQTVRRLVKQRLSKTVIALARGGVNGLMRLYPPQVRDKSELRALSAVDADFHRFDVFVDWGDGTPMRPQLCAFHDIFSGKILAWRLAATPNSATVLLTFGDLVEDYGIPEDVVMDNGREFAAKWITGGVPTRYRFKVKEDEPLGVLPQLGVRVHFTQPYSGQSKPVERAFRDLCSSVAKDPRLAGAYVGNRPDAKPENYGSRAVPRDEFVKVVAEGIAEFNARRGRRSQICAGRSFDQTFATSYAAAPIRKATAEQRRLWLLGAENISTHRSTGELTFMGNKYWTDWCVDIAGQKVTARFDPEDLHSGLHIYATDGRYLGFADCKEPVGFFDVEGGKAWGREKARLRRATRELLQAERRMDAAEHRKLLDRVAGETPEDLAAKVVRPEFGRKAPASLMAPPAAPAPRDLSPVEKAAHDALVVDFLSREAAPAPAEETATDRYQRARDLIARINEGKDIGEVEMAWLASYRASPEFTANEALYEVWGDGMFG